MTVGIVGFGRIGRAVAARLKPFRSKVVVFDPVVDAATIKAEGCTPAGVRRTAANERSSHAALPQQRKDQADDERQDFRQDEEGGDAGQHLAGTLVKTDDLVAALESGQISAVALDVTDPEPINMDNPLVKMDNVIINPHLASASPGAVTKLRTSVANIVAMAVKGQKLPNIVNGVK